MRPHIKHLHVRNWEWGVAGQLRVPVLLPPQAAAHHSSSELGPRPRCCPFLQLQVCSVQATSPWKRWVERKEWEEASAIPLIDLGNHMVFILQTIHLMGTYGKCSGSYSNCLLYRWVCMPVCRWGGACVSAYVCGCGSVCVGVHVGTYAGTDGCRYICRYTCRHPPMLACRCVCRHLCRYVCRYICRYVGRFVGALVGRYAGICAGRYGYGYRCRYDVGVFLCWHSGMYIGIYVGM